MWLYCLHIGATLWSSRGWSALSTKNRIKMVQLCLPVADHSIAWTCVQILHIKQSEQLHHSSSSFFSGVKETFSIWKHPSQKCLSRVWLLNRNYMLHHVLGILKAYWTSKALWLKPLFLNSLHWKLKGGNVYFDVKSYFFFYMWLFID